MATCKSNEQGNHAPQGQRTAARGCNCNQKPAHADSAPKRPGLWERWRKVDSGAPGNLKPVLLITGWIVMLGALLPLSSLLAAPRAPRLLSVLSLARSTARPTSAVSDPTEGPAGYSDLPYTGREATPARIPAETGARLARPTTAGSRRAPVDAQAQVRREWAQLDRAIGTPQPATATPMPEPTQTPEPTPPRTADGPPTRIVAEAIGLDTEVVPVGWRQIQQGNSTVSVWNVAEYAAGWHINSAVPGQGGNIVIAGHSDIKGEAFRYLERLKEGDSVQIMVRDRSFDYVVEEIHTVQEKGASAEIRRQNASFIGSFPEERLTLITCWPYGVATHRRIVVARPRM